MSNSLQFNNLNAYYDQREPLNLSDREPDEFNALLINALAAVVSPEQWREALTTATGRMGQNPWA